MSTITLQRSEREDDKVASASPINIHKIYNSLSRSYNEAHNKKNLLLIKRAIIMLKESVLRATGRVGAGFDYLGFNLGRSSI